MADETTMEERILALRAEHAQQLARASKRFGEGHASSAAIASESATKIASELADITRRLGNLCAEFRLLEWEPKPR